MCSCSQALLDRTKIQWILTLSSLLLILLVIRRNIKCQCVMEIRRGKNLITCDSVTEVKSCLLASSIKCDILFQDFLLKKAWSWIQPRLRHTDIKIPFYTEMGNSSHKTGIYCWSLRWVLLVALSVGVRQRCFWANTKCFWTPWNWGLRQPVPENLFGNRAVFQDVFWVGEFYTLVLVITFKHL